MHSIVKDKNTNPNLKELIDKYGNSILRMCFLYLKDRHLAEDALQDTFIKVYKNYHQFKGKSSEKTWIMRIAINVCKNYLRSSWWKHIDESAVLENVPAYDKNSNDELIIEIMRLSHKYKEVVILYYYQGLKIREIAQVLKIPESTVSVRLKRAREKLKKTLEDTYDYEY